MKMVHNGIEYADMQLIAEAYDLLRHGSGMAPAEIADVFRLERGRPRVVPDRDHGRGARPHRRRRPGSRSSTWSSTQAEQKGTGRWTVQTALDLGVAGQRHRRGGLRPRAVRSTSSSARPRARRCPGPSRR